MGLLAPFLTRHGPSRAPIQTLPRVAAVRGHVLCVHCHGETDHIFHFCQWCATSSSVVHDKPEAGTFHVNMDAVQTRFAQSTSAADASASATHRDATALLFEQFLVSRDSGGSQRVETAQPSCIVEFLCWLDSCGSRRRTLVHAQHCMAVGTSILDSCSTTSWQASAPCAMFTTPCGQLRLQAVGVLRTRLGHCLGLESNNLRTENFTRSALVTSCIAFSREEQKKAGVTVKKAPALLSSYLRALVVPMRARLCCTEDPYTRALLARDIALCTVAFRTTKRGDELSRTLIQNILRLPNECGLLFNFQWGMTLRSWADHPLTVI